MLNLHDIETIEHLLQLHCPALAYGTHKDTAVALLFLTPSAIDLVAQMKSGENRPIEAITARLVNAYLSVGARMEAVMALGKGAGCSAAVRNAVAEPPRAMLAQMVGEVEERDWNACIHSSNLMNMRVLIMLREGVVL